MTIAVDARTAGGEGFGTSRTVSHTCTGASLLLVFLGFGQGVGATGVGITYNGVALTQAIYVPASLGYWDGYIFYLTNPAAGAHNVVASWTNSVPYHLEIESLQGTDLTNPIRATDGQEYFGAGPFTKTLASSATDYVFSGNSGQGDASISAPLTKYLDQAESEIGDGPAAGGTVSVTWTPGYAFRGVFAATTIKAALPARNIIMF